MIVLSLVFAAPPTSEPVVQALEDELARTDGLALPDAPPLYGVRLHYAGMEQLEVAASFGSVLRLHEGPFHGLGVELRVGAPSYDNTGFGGWEDGFLRVPLARTPTYAHTRQVAWFALDRAYKEAVEQYARKSAQFAAPPDYPGDYWPPAPIQADDGPAPPPDWDRLPALAKALSAVFVPAGPALLDGRVEVGAEAGSIWLVDRAGTRLRRPVAEVSLRAYATLRTEDGEVLTDERYWCTRRAADLPPIATLEAEVEAMRDALLRRADAAPLTDEYVGPVIFEDGAALDLFRYLLVPQLEGTPPAIPFDTLFGDLGGGPSHQVRIGRRVLPEGWTTMDDPLLDPTHPAAYHHDWDGTPAQAVELVRDGIVQDLLMSRVPRKGLAPNGHGRSFLGTRAAGRAVQLEIRPPRHRSSKTLRRRALRMAAAYGLDHVMVIRGLQEFSVRNRAQPGFADGDGPRLPPPVELIRLRADGTEEVLRGAAFASVQRYLLRDIALAGPARSGTFLAPLDGDPFYLEPIEGMPTAIHAPDVLIREIELVPSHRDPRDRPLLEPPPPSARSEAG